MSVYPGALPGGVWPGRLQPRRREGDRVYRPARTRPDYPDNKAHANVYNPNAQKKRKTMAQKLVQKIVERGGILVEPIFPA
jgi:hypothetical protein